MFTIIVGFITISALIALILIIHYWYLIYRIWDMFDWQIEVDDIHFRIF